MCKIFVISSTAGLTRKQLDLVLRKLNNRFAESEGDGFGWAMPTGETTPVVVGRQTVTRQTHIVERFVSPASFGGLDGGLRVYDSLADVAKQAVDLPEADYLKPFPRDFSPSGPLLVHGRKASGSVALENTHPFHKDGWTMVHNGYVEPLDYQYEMKSTCDSEHLLNSFVYGDGPEEFHKRVEGRYAVAAIDGQGLLHVAKNALTNLWCSQTATLGWLFATDPRDLFSICKLLKLPRPVPVPVTCDRHIILKGGIVRSVDKIGRVLPYIPPVVNRYNNQSSTGWRHQAPPNPVAY